MSAPLPPLVCPACRHPLPPFDAPDGAIRCDGCGKTFPVILGIPDLRLWPDPYIELEADRAKGRRLAERYDEHSMAQLIADYYAMTPEVPPSDVERYTRSMIGGVARGEAALDAWTRRAGAGSEGPFLEVGCGTGPMLVSAAKRHPQAVGIDIAFRWLIVAKKRLEEAGVSVPLICACAEALPFPDGSYATIAADSAIEMFRDQALALREAHRVLRPGGSLFLTTPNRLSLGPDPHVGVWAAGYLPEKLVFRRLVAQGGRIPKRRLLTRGELQAQLAAAAFRDLRFFAPDVAPGQLELLPAPLRLAAEGYQLFKQLPLGTDALLAAGPLISVTATRS